MRISIYRTFWCVLSFLVRYFKIYIYYIRTYARIWWKQPNAPVYYDCSTIRTGKKLQKSLYFQYIRHISRIIEIYNDFLVRILIYRVFWCVFIETFHLKSLYLFNLSYIINTRNNNMNIWKNKNQFYCLFPLKILILSYIINTRKQHNINL